VETVPAFVPPIAFEDQMEIQDAGGASFGPNHARLFQALLQAPAAGFGPDAGAKVGRAFKTAAIA